MITGVTTPDASTRDNSGEGTISVHRFSSAKDNSDAAQALRRVDEGRSQRGPCSPLGQGPIGRRVAISQTAP
jgi:hypothetical protein